MKTFVRKLPRRIAWALATVGVLLLVAWIVQGSTSFQSCLEGDSEQLDDAGFVKRAAAQTAAPSAVDCLGDFMDSNEPTIVAFAMVVVAGFAGTLWAATKNIQRSTEQLALTAAETAQRQLRAYVSGTPQCLLPVDGNAPLRVRFNIHNSGATPAHEVRHRASVVVLSGGEFRLPSLSPNFSAPGVLFPNAELYGVATRESSLDEATFSALREGSARLYCYGEIDYVDAFMHPHTTRFCHELSGDPEAMRKLTSADAHDGVDMDFRIAPFGNAAN